MLFDVKHFIRDGLYMEWVADADAVRRLRLCALPSRQIRTARQCAVWLHRTGLALCGSVAALLGAWLTACMVDCSGGVCTVVACQGLYGLYRECHLVSVSWANATMAASGAAHCHWLSHLISSQR
jgi:hypothetical protein